MAREFNIQPRFFIKDFSDPAAPQMQEERDEFLEDMSIEELEAQLASRGLDTATEFDSLASGTNPEDPENLMELSVEELEAMVAEAEAQPPVLKERIEALPTQLEFTSPEITDERVVNIEEQVSGKPRGVQMLEQVFEPYKRASIVRNLLTAATQDTAAVKENTFQTELVADTPVFDIDKRIREIESNASGRDLNDDELDELFQLQDQRDAIEAEARNKFETDGAILDSPEISVGQMVEVAIDQPAEMGRVLLNETFRNPYTLFIPAGYAKAAHTVKNTASMLTKSAQVVRGAEIVGGTAGVSALASADAMAVDMAEQQANRGTVDINQSVEQAKVGAAIGATIGGGMGLVGAARNATKMRKLEQELFETVEEIDADKTAREILNPTYESNTNIVVDSAGESLILDKLDPIEASMRKAVDDQLAPKAVEELLAEQELRFESKMTREQRKQVGAQVQALKQEVLQLNEQLIKLGDRKFELIKSERSGNRVERDIRATVGNMKAVHQRFDESTRMLKHLEDQLLQDRDIGLEILRVQASDSRLKATDIEARVQKLADEQGLPRPTTREAALQFNTMDDVIDNGKVSPKVLTGVIVNPEKSFSQLNMRLDPPDQIQAPRNLFARADGFWNNIVDVTYGKSISRLGKLTEVSPTAKKLYNIMRHDGESLMEVPAHTERVMIRTGEFITRLKDSIDPMRSELFGRLNKKQSETVVRVLRGEDNISGGSDPVVQMAARNIRKVLNDFVTYARDAGHEVGFQGDYFPRVYDQTILRKPEMQQRFKKVLISHGVSPDKADKTIQKILLDGGILDFQVQTLKQDIVLADPQPLAKRSFDFIPDSELAPFMVNNLYDILNDYITNGVRAVEYTRSFGRGGRQFLEMYSDIVKEVGEAGGFLEKVESDRMFDLVNALHGNYGQFSSKFWQGASSSATVFQQLSTLPLATLTSLVEPFIGLSRVRPTSWVQGFAGAVKAQSNRGVRNLLKSYPADKLARETEELGLVMDAAVAEHLGSLFGGEINNKKMNKVSATFFRVNMLQQWTSFVRTGAYESGKIDIIKNLKYLSDPSLSRLRRDAIITDMDKLGVDYKAGVDWIKKGADVSDPYYMHLQEGALRYTNEVMVHPDATNRPIFFSSPKTSIFNQLLSYPIVFTNTVMKNWFDGFTQGNAYYKTVHGVRTAAAIAAMYMMSDFATSWREHLTWGEEGNPHLRNQTEAERAWDVANRAGFLGPAQIVADAYTSTRYGSDAVSSRMGPTVSMINQLFEGAGNIPDDDGDSFKKAVVRAAPFINITHDSRDFFYRDVLGGGELLRPVDFEGTQFETAPKPHQPSNYFWDRGPSDLPEITDELRGRTKLVPDQEKLRQKDVNRVIKIDPDTGEIQW